jgi:hypothetical protein
MQILKTGTFQEAAPKPGCDNSVSCGCMGHTEYSVCCSPVVAKGKTQNSVNPFSGNRDLFLPKHPMLQQKRIENRKNLSGSFGRRHTGFCFSREELEMIM